MFKTFAFQEEDIVTTTKKNKSPVETAKKIQDLLREMQTSVEISATLTIKELDILTDGSMYTDLFNRLYKDIGNTDVEMEKLISFASGIKLSGRICDEIIFRKSENVKFYVSSPHEKVDGCCISTHWVTYLGHTVDKATLPQAREFHLHQMVVEMTNKFGRVGFDVFRRGLCFVWKSHIINVGQLMFFAWCRCNGVLGYIEDMKNILRKRPRAKKKKVPKVRSETTKKAEKKRVNM
jgi:hypothetical protein